MTENYRKNDEVTLTITGMTSEGNGVGRVDGLAVFVPLTAVGDVARVRLTKLQKSFAYGIVLELLTPSPTRISVDCPVFEKCGGCAFRHISYAAELAIKSEFVSDAFKRIGKLDVDFAPILGCGETDFYRNKAQYPVAEIEGKAVCGFYSRRSHRVVPFTACRLQPKIFEAITNAIIEFINAQKIPAYNEETRSGILRHIYLREGFHTGEIMVCLVVAKPCADRLSPLCNTLVATFSNVKTIIMNVNKKDTNVILGNENKTLFGDGKIADVMCKNSVKLSPYSFYQVNTAQAERLYAIAAEYADLSGTESVLDLYCGVGTIGLSMAGNAGKILGVEVIAEAIENARENARASGIANAEFICGDAGEAAERLVKSGETPDVIIVDPPRKGCDEKTLAAVLAMAPKRVVMISCNPATAARDCAILTAGGYEVKAGRAVDLFARTGHVECVCLMTRKEK